jgi:hypothetical protein
MLPFGVNGATFRYSHSTGSITPVVLPFVTAAPGGGEFQGTGFSPQINNSGDLLFSGITLTDKGIHLPNEQYTGLGEGVYKQDAAGHISAVVVPGDAAPGGGTFDFATTAWGNNAGDIAFEGHLTTDAGAPPGAPPQSVIIGARGSVYVKEASGTIISIAHSGDPAPGGGVFQGAFGAHINNAGDVVFAGQLSPDFLVAGLFRYSKGVLSAVARPGDAMPGGGHLVALSQIEGNQFYINSRGDIVFNATLDTFSSASGLPDTGVYQWSAGKLTVIARTGTVIPGVGTIDTISSPTSIVVPPPPVFSPNGGAINNDHGQVLFSATLTDGRTVLLLYTPTPSNGSAAMMAAPVSVSVSAPILPPGDQKLSVTVNAGIPGHQTTVSPAPQSAVTGHKRGSQGALDDLFAMLGN